MLDSRPPLYQPILVCLTTLLQHDGYAGFAHVRHNPLPDLLAYFIIPNGIWLIAPLFVVNYFKNKILATTAAAEGKSK